jgi:hypothetical protein
MCSTGYSADVSAIFGFFPRMPQLAERRWLWPVKFAFEGTGIRRWHTGPILYPHSYKLHAVRSYTWSHIISP